MRIHIATGNGETAYDEAEAWKLWQQGSLPQDARYWKEGMADWQPLSSHFAAPDSSPNPYASNPYMDSTPAPVRGSYAYAKPPHTLTRILLGMLALSIVSDLALIGSNAMQLSLLSGDFTEEAGAANDARQDMLASIWMLIYFATIIPFAMWIHRINVNCRGFGARGMRCTPGWAVGYFFIPVMNLVRPYQAMKEVWQASQDPDNWQARGGSPLLGLWWGLWLLTGLLGMFSSVRAVRLEDHFEILEKATVLSIVEGIFGIALTVSAILLVRGIYRMQEALVNRKVPTRAGTPCRTLPGKARPPAE